MLPSLQDPAVSSMMSQMQNPMAAENMKKKMEGAQAPPPPALRATQRSAPLRDDGADSPPRRRGLSPPAELKDDPEIGPILAEIETGGPAVMMKCAAPGRHPGDSPVLCSCEGLAPLPSPGAPAESVTPRGRAPLRVRCRYWNDPAVLAKLGKAMGGAIPGALPGCARP